MPEWVKIVNLIEGFGWIVLGGFSFHQLWLLTVWFRCRKRPPLPRQAFDLPPPVTVQLPIFNERYVVERLLDAVSNLDYPKDLLEIQVIDDSTDDTTALVARHVHRLANQGFRIIHLRRGQRTGFKAGALSHGLLLAKGEMIALFDADFVPPPDFLRRTVDYFTDPSVGMVQTRWGHLNPSESLLTRAEALMLDGHFLIEQVARSRAGYFSNFNGSAGIWRKQAIFDSGGWQPDTLTEDFDLSYRAQLRGWRFIYLSDVVVPAELPVQMSSLKAQQHRWTKGSIQTAMKLLPQVWRSSQPWRVKVEACFHFGNWFHYPLGLLVAVLVLPMLVSRAPMATQAHMTWEGMVGCLLVATTVLFCSVTQRVRRGSLWRLLIDLPGLMTVTAGLALNNTRAIWEALCGVPSSFHRTPKYNGTYRQLNHKEYWPQPLRARWRGEVALGLYICIALGYAASQALYTALPFLVPLSAGFLYAGISSLAAALSLRAPTDS